MQEDIKKKLNGMTQIREIRNGRDAYDLAYRCLKGKVPPEEIGAAHMLLAAVFLYLKREMGPEAWTMRCADRMLDKAIPAEPCEGEAGAPRSTLESVFDRLKIYGCESEPYRFYRIAWAASGGDIMRTAGICRCAICREVAADVAAQEERQRCAEEEARRAAETERRRQEQERIAYERRMKEENARRLAQERPAGMPSDIPKRPPDTADAGEKDKPAREEKHPYTGFRYIR